jgi:uncharacterized membrane protein YdjX (TVP38/TMEM64 family)
MKKYLPLTLIAVVFVFSSFVSQEYSAFLKDIISKYELWGLLIYIIADVLSITLAPLTSIPFIPLVVEIWGVFWTIIASIIGWTLGSALAFWIARKYGASVVRKFITIDDKKEKFYKHISEKNVFWYLIFLRIIIPVDILSYMLGLFTDINWRMFMITTVIGIIPGIVALSFVGSFPIKYQVGLSFIGITLLVIFLFVKNKFFKK